MKQKKENTLFSYFKKLNDPVSEKASLSSIIDRSSTVITRTPSKKDQQPIDLTLDNDDDDVIMIPSSPSSEVSSQVSSQSSFTTRERIHNEVITNTSKYNNKAWSVKTKERGPQVSSQDASTVKHQPAQKFERIVIKKSRPVSKPTYDWLGPDDIQPYNSNYTPYTMQDPMHDGIIRKPTITPIYGSTQNPSNYDTGKRKWDTDESGRRQWDGDFSRFPTASQSNENAKKFWSDQSIGKKAKIDPNRKLGSFATYDRQSSNSSFNKSNTSDKEYQPDLSSEQERVLNMVLNEQKSLFFTGSAGTGKSVLLRAIIDKLGERYGSQLAVTASTGIAACNINGCTLHSFAGIGIGTDSASDLAGKINSVNRKAKDRWINTKVLIIDEISMVDNVLFDKLDEIAKIVRGNQLPFGGIQLIVTGDFFQLPPVSPTKVAKFAFEASTWTKTITQTVMLTKVFRQKDGTFVRILNEMRLGILSPEAINKFKSLSRPPMDNDGIKPTELYPLRHEVDESNRRRLAELKGEPVTFEAIDRGDPRKMQNCLAPAIMILKLDAQVMLLKNIDIDLVNGSIGVVVGFVGQGKYARKDKVAKLRTPNRIKDAFTDDMEINMTIPFPVVKFSGGRELVLERESWSVELPGGKESASRSQIPLMLAWAISIHKSQGQTLDRVKVDLGKVFERGQAYVALSRATSLDRLQILNFDPKRVMAHPTVTKFYQSLKTV